MNKREWIARGLATVMLAGGCLGLTGCLAAAAMQTADMSQQAADRTAAALAQAEATTCPEGQAYRAKVQQLNEIVQTENAEAQQAKASLDVAMNFMAQVPQVHQRLAAAQDHLQAVDATIEASRDIMDESGDNSAKWHAAMGDLRAALMVTPQAVQEVASALAEVQSLTPLLEQVYPGIELPGGTSLAESLALTAAKWREAAEDAPALVEKMLTNLERAEDDYDNPPFAAPPYRVWTAMEPRTELPFSHIRDVPIDYPDNRTWSLSGLLHKLDGSIRVTIPAQQRAAEKALAKHAQEAVDAAYHAQRFAWLAVKACDPDAVIPPEAEATLANPFNSITHPYPEWNSTFWDFNSP